MKVEISEMSRNREEGNFMTAYAKKMFLLLCFSGFLFTFIGCEQQGPAERAGEKVDESMEKAGDKMERAGEKVQDAAN
jgi:hypothetical protein